MVVALFIAGSALVVEAQTNTVLGSGALGKLTTGTGNTALGFDALFEDTTGDLNTAVGANTLGANITSGNTAIGANALFANSSGGFNTAIGLDALFANSTASLNTAVGHSALRNNTGDSNTATGSLALDLNTTGSGNTAMGQGALFNNTIGNGNIAVGIHAGQNISTENNNIDIGNLGKVGESNTIRIGTKGTQTRAFIASVNSSPIFGVPVVVNTNGRLGIQASSARYKRDIHDMGDASERLMKLRPVTFRYKEDPARTVQYGLVAEEVARVYPELVTYGDDGEPLSVAYHLLPVMLLNELQKEMRENRRKDTQIAALQKQVEALQKETARIDGLTARLNALEQQARAARPERLTAAIR